MSYSYWTMLDYTRSWSGPLPVVTQGRTWHDEWAAYRDDTGADVFLNGNKAARFDTMDEAVDFIRKQESHP